jgi:glucosamine-6-phosphate deaminase
MVGRELGFRQKLPRKRDSLVDDVAMLAPKSQTNGIKLSVPQLDVSCSSSPVLEPMSARLSNEEAKILPSMDALEDSPTTRMSARVLD